MLYIISTSIDYMQHRGVDKFYHLGGGGGGGGGLKFSRGEWNIGRLFSL